MNGNEQLVVRSWQLVRPFANWVWHFDFNVNHRLCAVWARGGATRPCGARATQPPQGRVGPPSNPSRNCAKAVLEMVKPYQARGFTNC